MGHTSRMSWFSDLADKAETLLNKIDQNAASVLQEKEKRPKYPAKINSDSNNCAVRELLPESSGSSVLSLKSNSFINKDEDVSLDIKTNRVYSSPSKTLIPKNVSETSIDIDDFHNSSNYLLKSDGTQSNRSDISDDETKIFFEARHSPEIIEQSFSIASSDETAIAHDIVVYEENELLKNEISVVNNELSMLLAKAKNAEKITEKTKNKLAQMQNAYDAIKSENDILQKKVMIAEQKISNSESEDEMDEIKSENRSLSERVKQLELSIISITSLKNDIENDLKESKSRCSELEEKLERAKTDNANIMEEWKNYKIRANNSLTMKEKIIEELGGNKSDSETDAINALNAQINHLKTERNEAMEELSRLQSEYEYKSKEIDQIEIKLRATERQVSSLTEALRFEKSSREIAEHTVNNLSKELKMSQNEMTKQISSLRSKLRETTVTKADKQFSSEISNKLNVSENGEDRFRTLTQALVSKQAALESVTADRNALRLQLEKTENKYRSDLIKMRNNTPRIINVNDTDDVKARFPLLQESPWDSGLSRGVKKAYSSLDSFSVRIGVFLRRNPIARIFIITYMIILHLWVLIVLCTYTPEVHPN